MKKPLLVLLFLAIVTIIKAQPTITTDNIYAVGDELIMQSADTAGIDEGPSGSNQTWDFSNMTDMGFPVNQDVVSASSTPYASSFPGADLALDAGGDNYVYFDISGGDMFELGFGSSTVIVPYTDPQKFLSYPITYNSTFTDQLAGIFEVNGFVNDRSGTVTFLADGYGKLILPSATFNNALRMKYVQNIDDVIDIGPVSITSTTVTTTYIWMVPGNKNALMDISHIKVTSSGFTQYSNSVFYYPGATGAENLIASNVDIQLYPNPATEKATISMNLEKPGHITCSILNISGQVVKTVESSEMNAGLYQSEIDLKDLAGGLYFLKLETNDHLVGMRLL